MNHKKNKNIKTLTIKKVRFTSKWVEFWFYEDEFPKSSEGWQLSSKSYMLFNLLSPDEENALYNDGLVGRQITWKYTAPNWEILEFPHQDNFRTWIGKVITKRSGKPFKSTKKVDIPIGLVFNTLSGKVAFKLNDSIVDCTQCILVDVGENDE